MAKESCAGSESLAGGAVTSHFINAFAGNAIVHRDFFQNGAAMFYAPAQQAIGAMKGFYEQGVSVPNDISIVGFDDLEISKYLTPGLTTVRQEISQKGEKAVELLLDNIQDADMTKREVIIPVSLSRRESVRDMRGEE